MAGMSAGMPGMGSGMSYGQAMAEIGRIRMQFDAVINVAQQMKRKAVELNNAGEKLKNDKNKVCGSEWIGIDADAFSNKVDGLVGDAGRAGSVLYHADALQKAGEALEQAAIKMRTQQENQVRKLADIY